MTEDKIVIAYVCDECYYFVDGSNWDEAVCCECVRNMAIKDQFRPKRKPNACPVWSKELCRGDPCHLCVRLRSKVVE